MTKSKNFSFSEFMSFSESLVDTLETVSQKLEEVSNQVTTLESVLGNGDEEGSDVSDEVNAEENVEIESDETPVAEDVSTEESVDDAPVSEDVSVEESVDDAPVADTENTSEEEVSDEANDTAAIDALSEEEGSDENFSDKYMVVGLKNRPWGNRVIKATDFSEKEHRKLIPTLFSTQAQAQRAMTSYNVNGENFSVRYQHANGVSTSTTRYQQVKGILNL